MERRYGTDHAVESLRRSLVMLESNQLALTRDQGLALVRELIAAREQLRRHPTRPADGRASHDE